MLQCDATSAFDTRYYNELAEEQRSIPGDECDGDLQPLAGCSTWPTSTAATKGSGGGGGLRKDFDPGPIVH